MTPLRTIRQTAMTPLRRAGVKSRQRIRGVMAVLASAALIASTMVAGAGAATADTAPPNPNDPKTPVTVSADVLPTVQINGVVWNQTIIGNTVYAAGSFSTARPSGAAPNTQTVTRNNLLAYNLSTGALITSFAPSLNAQAYSITASPDGSRLYVGGDFTSISGTQVWRVAALNPTTGAVITSFLPRMGASVRAITVSNSTVYMGGLFPNVGSVTRNRLAAVRASDGVLLPWAPSANQRVNAMVLSPNADQVVIGGVFTELNGSNRPGYGLGRVDAVTGATLPLDANNVVRDAGPQSAILSLSSDGNNFYGTGYIYGTGGNLEGGFSANWSDGKIRWVQDCHGDSYGAWASPTAVYMVGHAHYCLNIGGFPETTPRSYHRALAFSNGATGVMTKDTQGYPSFTGVASPSLLNWYPDLDAGSYTGQSQGPWTVTGNDDYVALAGEFRNVNGTAQQGLVRFAVSSIAPNKQGPRNTVVPTASYVSPGRARVTWQTYWDRDNTNLSYSVIRDGNTGSPVYQVNQISTFWQLPTLNFTDSGLSAGNHSYRIITSDPFGNTVNTATVNVNVPVGGTGNSPPTAAFNVTNNALQISVNASASSDPDGNISSYAWNFGDSTTGTGQQTTHTYAQAGTYQVTLTVTDNSGATATTSRTVQVSTTPPVGGVVISDDFNRTLSSGLGSADLGGSWTLNGGPQYFAVASGAGQWKLLSAGSGPSAYLRGVSLTSANSTAVVSLNKAASGGPVYTSLAGRSISGAGEYRAKLRFDAGGQVTLSTTRVVGSTETTLGQVVLAGIVYTANTKLQIRIEVTGTSPTTVRAKAWVAGAAEPGAWALQSTDNSSALQSGGGVGIVTYISGGANNAPLVVGVDSLSVSTP
ncbi:PKD domain-containing protein [Arthrobacter sp. HLT1-20]